MQEETKEEYLARLKKERGIEESLEELQSAEPEKRTFKERLKGLFLLLLFALFLWAVIEMFGMMKAN